MTDFEIISRQLDARRDAAIELQRGLTAIPALCPRAGGDGEARKVAWLRAYLERIGIPEIDEIRAPDPEAPQGYRPNLIARLPGHDRSRTMWLMTHTDVVGAGNLEAWDGDPWTIRVDGDRVYGRGVEDNQQGLVGSVLLAEALLAAEITPPIDLGLLFVADEETGNGFGVEYVLEHAELFQPEDLILVPDGGLPDGSMIDVAEKGILWFEFTVRGVQCHASTPDQGLNAHRVAAHLVVALEGLAGRFDRADALYDPPRSTFEPTRRRANVESVNIIPGEEVFALDCRVLPDYALDDVIAAVQEICAEVERRFTRGDRYPCEVQVVVDQRLDSAPATGPDAPIVTRLQAAVRQVYGVEAKPMGIGGGTVAAFIRRKGFSAAVWSRLDESLHMPNEYCLLSNLLGDAKVFAHVLLAA